MWCVYAVCSGEVPQGAVWPQGLSEGEGVRPLPLTPGMFLLASELPNSIFEADGNGRSRAADPAWISAAALAHHEVVASAHQLGDSLPLQFGTVFRDEVEVEFYFRRILPELAQRVKFVSGCEEVEVTLAGAETMPAARQMAEWLKLEAAAGASLRAVTRRSAVTKAYLVTRGATALLDNIAASEGRFRLEGVWPPYSFTGEELVLESLDAPVEAPVEALALSCV